MKDNPTTEPTQLPAEVREAVFNAYQRWFESTERIPIQEAVCAALAPLWADAQRDKERLIEAMEHTIGCVPAYHEGEFVHMHYDGEGRELGLERIDPASVIQHMSNTLRAAIDQAMKETSK